MAQPGRARRFQPQGPRTDFLLRGSRVNPSSDSPSLKSGLVKRLVEPFSPAGPQSPLLQCRGKIPHACPHLLVLEIICRKKKQEAPSLTSSARGLWDGSAQRLWPPVTFASPREDEIR